ncbi:hypothetical protein Dimus_009011 [Dionaea muscipula]
MIDRRGPDQRRVVKDSYDSRSPGPRHPVMFRGSPSPPTTFHRRPAPSPGSRAHRHRSPSLILSESVDPDATSSSEVGESTVMSVTTSEEEDDGQRGEEEGMRGSAVVPDLSPISEDENNQGGSSSSISGSPILSPEAAIRFCQAALDAGGHVSASSPSHSHLFAEVRADFGVVESTSTAVPRMGEVEGAVDGAPLAAVESEEVDLGGALGGYPAAAGDAQCPTVAIVDALCINSSTVNNSHLPLSSVALPIGDGGTVFGEFLTLGFRADSLFAMSGAVSQLPQPSDAMGHCGGGVVSEEERVLSVARGALRPQPVDGLRQPLSSPVEPVSIVEGGDAALASGTMGKLDGCVLISGTGSISYGFTEDGHEVRAGGGGPVLGDWGRFFLISLILGNII